MADVQRLRVLIVGSCVSRDTFVFLDPDRFVLEDYVARQGLASGFGPADAAPRPHGAAHQPVPATDDRG